MEVFLQGNAVVQRGKKGGDKNEKGTRHTNKDCIIVRNNKKEREPIIQEGGGGLL